MKKQKLLFSVRIFLSLTLVLILSLVSCDNINSNEEDDNDVKTFTGVIRLTDDYNTCSNGFDNYELYIVTDSTETLLLVINEPGSSKKACLPNSMRYDEMPVIFTGIFQPCPPNVRCGGRLIILLYSIEPL